MKRLALVALLVAGCTAIDPERPRRYQCTVKSDCRGDWVCTLDGFCADPAVGEEMSCEEQKDCTGGWLCALTGSCVDPSEGKPLPCFEATDCPGQWKCTLLGQCADPDAGVAWPCASTDDCTADWHCGPAGVCYDLLEAADVRCRPDAGDCGPDWRCGLEGVCHLRDVGAPLRCTSDSDCEGGWSCDSLGTCADARSGFPRAPADGGAPVATPVVPLLDSTVDHLAVGGEFSMGIDTNLRAVAFTKGTTLYVMLVGNTFALDAGPQLPDGGYLEPQTTRSFLHSRTVSGATKTLSVFQGSVVRADTNGGLEQYAVDRNGLRLVATLDAGFPITEVRQGSTLQAHAVIAFNSNRLAWWTDAGTANEGMPGLLDVYPYTQDTLYRDETQSGGSELLLADRVFLFSTQSNLLASGIDTPGTRYPITFPSRVTTPLRLGGEHFIGGTDAGIWPGYFDTNSNEPRGANAQFLNGASGERVFRVRDNVPMCATPPDFFTSYRLASGGNGSGSGFLTHCDLDARDGGTEEALFFYEQANPSYGLEYVPSPAGWRFSENNQGAFGVSIDGQLAISALRGYQLMPLFPTEPSPRLHHTVENPLILVPGRKVSPESCDDIESFQCEEWFKPAQCNRDTSGQQVCSEIRFPLFPVRNRPKWVVMDLRGPDVPMGAAPFLFASLRMGGLEFDAFLGGTPNVGELGAVVAETRADGGTLALVGGNDRLYWGDFSVLPEFSYSILGKADSVRFAATPLPGGTITDIAPLAVDPSSTDARFAEGLLISSGRPFRYFASNSVVWRTTELTFSGDEAVSVHPLGRLARIVYRDGSVFSYPSRVQIAPPLAAASVVIATAMACDQLFALTAGGLYWLRGDASGAGQWTLVQTAAGDFAGGSLLGEPDSGALYLYLPGGKSQRIAVGCGG